MTKVQPWGLPQALGGGHSVFEMIPEKSRGMQQHFYFLPPASFFLGLLKMCLSCWPCMWSSLEFCVALDSEKKRKISHMTEVMGVENHTLCRALIERTKFWDEIYFNI